MIFTALQLTPVNYLACEMPNNAQAIENRCGEGSGQPCKEPKGQHPRCCSPAPNEVEDARDQSPLTMVESAAHCSESGEVHVGLPTLGDPTTFSGIRDRVQIGLLRCEHV